MYELSVCTDNIEAQKKIDALTLTKTEWDHVEMFVVFYEYVFNILHLSDLQLTNTYYIQY